MFSNLVTYITFIIAILSVGMCISGNNRSPASVRIYQEIQSESQITDADPKEVVPRCGKVLSENNDRIFYKPFDSVLPNERCAWIIGVPGAVGHNIYVEYLGFPTNIPGSGQNLVLTGVESGPVFTSYIPESSGSFNVTNSNLIIVTFFSSERNETESNGFSLQYEVLDNSNSTKRSSTNSKYYLIESPTLDLKHPTTGQYDNLELSVFLFLPMRSMFIGQNNHVWFKRAGLEECLDSLRVYSLNVNGLMTDRGSGIWTPQGKICDNVKSFHIQSQDMILYLFQSDQSATRGGFSFSYIAS